MQRHGGSGHSGRIGTNLDSDREHPAAEPPRFEPLDVPPFLPFWLGALIAAFVGGVLLWITIGFPLAVHQESRKPLTRLPPAPQLESAPVRHRLAYEAAKQAELDGRDGSTMSIDAAMRATAQQGWGPPK